jgi:hypothetical protein
LPNPCLISQVSPIAREIFCLYHPTFYSTSHSGCVSMSLGSFENESIAEGDIRPALASIADYRMYAMFLTVSPGSVLFGRSNLLKRKDLCFSCLRLGLDKAS